MLWDLLVVCKVPILRTSYTHDSVAFTISSTSATIDDDGNSKTNVFAGLLGISDSVGDSLSTAPSSVSVQLVTLTVRQWTVVHSAC